MIPRAMSTSSTATTSETLIEDTMITSDDGYKSRRPAILVDSDDMVHITWQDYRGSENEVWYTKLDPSEDDQDGDMADEGDITVVDDTALTEDDGYKSHIPRMAIDSNDRINIV